jgi:hypothetical protein
MEEYKHKRSKICLSLSHVITLGQLNDEILLFGVNK